MSTPAPVDYEWKRSGDKIQDLLHLYESSSFYDCTFKVGSTATIFKCHKLILAAASPVFEKMLCGPFKEGNMGSDEQIVLSNVTPPAFHCAMEFMYGNKTDFGDVSTATATATFLFAHEMLLLRLMEAVEEYLKSKAAPANIFVIYEAFKLTDYKAGLEWSWKVVGSNTSEALKSKWWKDVSADTLNDLLNATVLTVGNETEIFEALSVWGLRQARKKIGREPTYLEVRTELQEHLKLVKFLTMSVEEFAKLDMASKTLSVEEKHGIYRSLVLKSSHHLPEGYSTGEREYLSAKAFAFSVPTTEHESSFENLSQAMFTFKINKRAYLVGLKLHDSMGYLKSFQLFNEEMTEYYGNGHSDATCSFDEVDYYAVLNSSILEANKFYKLIFALNWESIENMGLVEIDARLENGNLTVEIPDQCCVNVTDLVFKFVL